MRFLKLSLFLLSAFFLLSCNLWNYMDIIPNQNITYPPTPDLDKVQFYYVQPPIDFEIIGELWGRTLADSSRTNIETKMQIPAATIGGDAVIPIDRRETYAGTDTTALKANAIVYGNYIYYTYPSGAAIHKEKLIGLVIKWKEKK